MPYMNVSTLKVKRPLKTINPSTYIIDFPMLVLKYLAMTWSMMSVPPVVNPDLKIMPYPMPLKTAPKMAISIFSTFSK